MAEVKETKEPVLKNPLYKVKDQPVNEIGPTAIRYLSKNKLEIGKTLCFRLLRSSPSTDPKDPKGIVYPNVSLRTQFWVNDKENGPTEIAAVQTVNRDGSYRIKKFWVDGSASKNGEFVLFGDSVEHVQILPYLLLSPENKTSPFYDKTNAPLYELVDLASEAKINVNRVSDLMKAYQAVTDLADADIDLFNLAFGGDATDLVEQKLDRLMRIAAEDPNKFLKNIDSATVKNSAIVKQAIDANIIQYDPQQHRILWVAEQETIALLEREDEASEIDQFAAWLEKAAEGGKVKKMLQSQLKK